MEFLCGIGSDQVGPNAANLRETPVLSHPYAFLTEVEGIPADTYVCNFWCASPDRDFFFDIPGDPW